MRQKDQKFKVILRYLESLRTAWAWATTPSLEQTLIGRSDMFSDKENDPFSMLKLLFFRDNILVIWFSVFGVLCTHVHKKKKEKVCMCLYKHTHECQLITYGSRFFPPYGFQRLNSGYQAKWQVPLPTKPWNEKSMLYVIHSYRVEPSCGFVSFLPSEYNDRFHNTFGRCTENERQRWNSTSIYWFERNKQVSWSFHPPWFNCINLSLQVSLLLRKSVC